MDAGAFLPLRPSLVFCHTSRRVASAIAANISVSADAGALVIFCIILAVGRSPAASVAASLAGSAQKFRT